MMGEGERERRQRDCFSPSSFPRRLPSPTVFRFDLGSAFSRLYPYITKHKTPPPTQANVSQKRIILVRTTLTNNSEGKLDLVEDQDT